MYNDYFSDVRNFLNPETEVNCSYCGGAIPNWCLEEDEPEWYCPWCGDICNAFWLNLPDELLE